MIPVPKTEPFFGLRGLDPVSEFITQPKSPPTTGPFGNDLFAQIKVSPEEIWGGVGTRFPHPKE